LLLVAGACGGTPTGSPSSTGPPNSTQLSLGLVASSEGYIFQSTIASMPAGSANRYMFVITGPDGKPVTESSYILFETKLLHFYAVRADLTGFNHIHPALGPDGTWTTTAAEPLRLQPGPYRVFIQFEVRDAQGLIHSLVLSRPLEVTGTYSPVPVPPPSNIAQVDGYTVTISPPSSTGAMVAHFTFKGAPVGNLEPYLNSWAHLSAFQEETLGFGHLHPLETPQTPTQLGGPDLTFHAHFQSGTFRVFLQFRADGLLHTAAFTLSYP
ncbi:MAG: hypothetical protein ACRD3W_02260, partial [Terriglobales bacterium]